MTIILEEFTESSFVNDTRNDEVFDNEDNLKSQEIEGKLFLFQDDILNGFKNKNSPTKHYSQKFEF